MKNVAICKRYGLLIGEVLETLPDRVMVDRTWLFGSDNKKSIDNHVLLIDVNIVQMSNEEFEQAVFQACKVWDESMTAVLAKREEWKKTWNTTF